MNSTVEGTVPWPAVFIPKGGPANHVDRSQILPRMSWVRATRSGVERYIRLQPNLDRPPALRPALGTWLSARKGQQPNPALLPSHYWLAASSDSIFQPSGPDTNTRLFETTSLNVSEA